MKNLSKVLSAVPAPGGWGPIAHMVQIAARVFEASVMTRSLSPESAMQKIRRRLRRRQIDRTGQDILLCIVPDPGTLRRLVHDPAFEDPAALRVAWIIDAFRTERAPVSALAEFDVIVVSQATPGDISFYEAIRPGQLVLHIPVGTDALTLGSATSDRPTDILRVGRQPPAWDDDGRSRAAAAARGLSFQGRPPAGSHGDLAVYYRSSKFTVAFSNLVAPARHTHPTKAYVTPRWMDALACGVSVAGIPPREDDVSMGLLRQEALLEFDTIDLEANMAQLQEARATWTPAVAVRNHVCALERLDWRWRLKTLAAALGIESAKLEADLAALTQRAAALTARII